MMMMIQNSIEEMHLSLPSIQLKFMSCTCRVNFSYLLGIKNKVQKKLKKKKILNKPQKTLLQEHNESWSLKMQLQGSDYMNQARF